MKHCADNENQRDDFAADSRCAYLDVPCVMAVFDDACRTRGWYIGARIVDLSKAREMVDLWKLYSEAREVGLPHAILRLAIKAYEAPRRVKVSGSLSTPVTTILAGCGNAGDLMNALMITPTDRGFTVPRSLPTKRYVGEVVSQ